MLHLSTGSQCRLRPSQQRTLLYILSVLPEKSLMRNLCVRDRMATDAPLVATVKGTESEAIAAGLGNGIGNTLVLEVTSRVVGIQKIRPLKKTILSSEEQGSGARLRCRESEKSSVENGSPE